MLAAADNGVATMTQPKPLDELQHHEALELLEHATRNITDAGAYRESLLAHPDPDPADDPWTARHRAIARHIVELEQAAREIGGEYSRTGGMMHHQV